MFIYTLKFTLRSSFETPQAATGPGSDWSAFSRLIHLKPLLFFFIQMPLCFLLSDSLAHSSSAFQTGGHNSGPRTPSLIAPPALLGALLFDHTPRREQPKARATTGTRSSGSLFIARHARTHAADALLQKKRNALNHNNVIAPKMRLWALTLAVVGELMIGADAIYLPTIFNSKSGETRAAPASQAQRRARARRAGPDGDCSTMHFGPGCQSIVPDLPDCIGGRVGTVTFHSKTPVDDTQYVHATNLTTPGSDNPRQNTS
jgi:hypothetical protein